MMGGKGREAEGRGGEERRDLERRKRRGVGIAGGIINFKKVQIFITKTSQNRITFQFIRTRFINWRQKHELSDLYSA